MKMKATEKFEYYRLKKHAIHVSFWKVTCVSLYVCDFKTHVCSPQAIWKVQKSTKKKNKINSNHTTLKILFSLYMYDNQQIDGPNDPPMAYTSRNL